MYPTRAAWASSANCTRLEIVAHTRVESMVLGQPLLFVSARQFYVPSTRIGIWLIMPASTSISKSTCPPQSVFP